MKDLTPEVAESVRSLQEAAAMVTRPYQKKEPLENTEKNDSTDPDNKLTE